MESSICKNETLVPTYKAGQAATTLSVAQIPENGAAALAKAVLRTAGSRALRTAAATAAACVTASLMTGHAVPVRLRYIWTEGP